MKPSIDEIREFQALLSEDWDERNQILGSSYDIKLYNSDLADDVRKIIDWLNKLESSKYIKSATRVVNTEIRTLQEFYHDNGKRIRMDPPSRQVYIEEVEKVITRILAVLKRLKRLI